jgi:transcriptional regulator with XRE-family HTH domain
VQRLVLGSQLHRLRESRGITAEQAAEAIRGSHSKISRMERGRVGFKERDVADLLTLYGVTDTEERAALLNLAREANTPGWWHEVAPHDRRLRIPVRCDRGERGYWRALGQVAVGRRDLIRRMIAEQADGSHRLLTSWRSGSWPGAGGRGAVSWA